MGIPSVKRLEANFPGKGKKLRKLMEVPSRADDCQTVKEWIAMCLRPPSAISKLMCALDEVLDGFVVECLFGDSIEFPDMEYVNLGDAYNTTIIYDHITLTFKIQSWGDWVEVAERAGRHY